jgi:methylase of polypeptide subunit release factors
MTAASADPEFPLRIGNPEDFTRVVKALRSPGFEESAVHRTLRKAGFSALGSASSGPEDSTAVNTTVLMKLFVELLPVPRAEVEYAMDRATLDSFLALDLVRVCDSDPSHYRSPVFLYPVGDMLIASDHYNKPLGPDSVFPAIQTGTLHFMKFLPRSPAAEGLDLCSGTGICALVLSRHIQRVTASDVTARSTHFARFNRLLNNRCNVEAVQGDLYSSVEGRTFDRIVAHPPYVPSLEGAETWRDGGSNGEAITRRIVQGLPRSLRPGGEFLALCLGSELDNSPFERRARDWLGEDKGDFDIIFAVQRYLSPRELAEQATTREPADVQAGKTASLEAAFHEAGVTRFAFGALAIKRHDGAAAEAWTMRTRLSSRTDAASFASVFARSRQCSPAGVLPDLRPRLAPALAVTVPYKVDGSKFVAGESTLETDWPFTHAMKADPWIFPVVARFDGSRTVSDVYTEARAGGAIPPNIQLEDFTSLISMMIIQGYLALGDSEEATQFK